MSIIAWLGVKPIARRGLLLGAFALASLGFAQTDARADWPDKQITLVVCFPAGGGTDIAMRMFNVQLGEALGKPVIVENRGGAGGNIAISAVQRTAPDGYTLLGCSSAFVVNTSLYANATYDPLKDFVPIIVLGASPNVIVVPAKSDIKTFKEFVERAKANPGKLNWTSSGVGTTPHLGIELLKQRLGLDIVHIPFAGAGPATQAAAAGQVDIYTANLGSLGGHIAGGTFRALAVTSKERWPDLPDVPTLNELGVKDAEADTFQAVYAPAATPQEIVDRLVKEIKAILERPDVKEKYRKSGLPVVGESGEAFKARIAREVPMYKAIIDKAGLKVK
jgi:tripartite-type tricarboxylate transporter receptor subunit TctC